MNHIELKKLAETNATANILFHFCKTRKRSARGSISEPGPLALYMTRRGFKVTTDALRGILEALAAYDVGTWDGSRFKWKVSMRNLGQFAVDKRTPVQEVPAVEGESAHITIEAPGLRLVIDTSSTRALELVRNVLGAA